MDENTRRIVDGMKKEMIEGARQAAEANKVIPVTGKRYNLPLAGRVLDMVYYPAKKENASLLLGFHGGGFLFGGSAMDDAMWSTMAEKLEMNVASIGYRLAPDYQYPAPIEDAYDSAVYLKDHAEDYGFDPEHISVGGCSAGGNIAASVCLMANRKGKIRFDHQILIYPCVDQVTDPTEKGDGSLSGPMLYVFNELYLVPGREKEQECSPIFADRKELEKLPHAIIIRAENDCLKHEAKAYEEKLKEAGVRVESMQADSMPHGFYEYGFGTGMGQDFLEEGIKRGIADGTIAKAAEEALDFIKENL